MPRVYDNRDTDVIPPVVLEQNMPAWRPPWEQVGRQTFNGRLELVIGEDGSVHSADIVRPSFVPYDGLVLQATRRWRYRPATKQGHPVQYRRIIDYVLKGSESS